MTGQPVDRHGAAHQFGCPSGGPPSSLSRGPAAEPAESHEDAVAATPLGGRVVVLGLGNPVLSDDGVGLAVAGALARRLAELPLPGVDVLCSARAGFELIDLLRGYARAVIVDCLVLPDPQPGRVRRLTLDDVAGSARLVNMHEISVDVAFRLAKQLGIPMPSEVVIFAVEAADTTTVGEGLTPHVAAAVEPLARAIHDRLRAAPPPPLAPDTEQLRRRRISYAPGGLG